MEYRYNVEITFKKVLDIGRGKHSFNLKIVKFEWEYIMYAKYIL